MFKKGDVVVFTTRGGELVKEDERFVVHVLEDQEEQSHFVGQVTERGHRATHRIGVTSHYWSAKQFKLKQQDVVSDDTPDNAFPVLKDGMVIETRRGRLYVVCGEKFLRPNGFQWKRDYSAEGRTGRAESDIVKVWSGASLFGLDLGLYAKGRSDEIIWKEKKNAEKIASLRSQVDSLQEQIKQLEEEDNV